MKNDDCKISRWQLLKARLHNLDPQAFAKKIEETSNPVILDVRTSQEYHAGTIPGAENMDYLGSSFWQQFEALPTGRPVFVFCRTERRSLRVGVLLHNAGFKEVYNLDGGLARWVEVFGRLQP